MREKITSNEGVVDLWEKTQELDGQYEKDQRRLRKAMEKMAVDVSRKVVMRKWATMLAKHLREMGF